MTSAKEYIDEFNKKDGNKLLSLGYVVDTEIPVGNGYNVFYKYVGSNPQLKGTGIEIRFEDNKDYVYILFQVPSSEMSFIGFDDKISYPMPSIEELFNTIMRNMQK